VSFALCLVKGNELFIYVHLILFLNQICFVTISSIEGKKYIYSRRIHCYTFNHISLNSSFHSFKIKVV
jgi:hypothetical protein